MDEETASRHLDAGRRAGRDSTCGTKVDYKSEQSADRAAAAMMGKGSKELEAYPCFFCDGWHIGRKMSEEELTGETVGSAEIVANLTLARLGMGSRVGESVWVVIDDENWLVEGYGVLSHDGRLMLYLATVGGRERTYDLPAGERLPRHRITTERGTP